MSSATGDKASGKRDNNEVTLKSSTASSIPPAWWRGKSTVGNVDCENGCRRRTQSIEDEPQTKTVKNFKEMVTETLTPITPAFRRDRC